MTDVSNSADFIDSRDVIERIEELEAIPIVDRYDDEQQELDSLGAFAEEGESFPDWHYGVTFIRDSYFEEYAEEYAEDIGAIDRNAGWPLMHIDWEAAADSLQSDYTSIDYDGVTYWGRA